MSQIATAQLFKSAEGKKKAAMYFQVSSPIEVLKLFLIRKRQCFSFTVVTHYVKDFK